MQVAPGINALAKWSFRTVAIVCRYRVVATLNPPFGSNN